MPRCGWRSSGKWLQDGAFAAQLHALIADHLADAVLRVTRCARLN